MKVRDTDTFELFNLANVRFKNCAADEKHKDIPDSLVLKLTTQCNLSCKYCYMGENTKTPEIMDKSLMINIIKQADSLLNVPVTIYLHGGEPCIQLPLIEELCKCIDEGMFRNELRLMLQTNGTIMSDRLIDIIKRYKINVGVSLDGTLDESNSGRRFKDDSVTTGTIIRNIKRFRDEGIEIGIFSVLTSLNIKSVTQSIEQLSKMGIRSYVVNPLVLWGNAKGQNELMADKDDVSKYYIELINWISSFNQNLKPEEQVFERNIRWWYRALKYGAKGYMCNRSPCGAGICTAVFSASGDVYTCDQFYGDKKFCIGNIKETDMGTLFKEKKSSIESLQRSIFDIAECRQCSWKHICSGGCAAASYYYYQDMLHPSPFCEAYKKVFEYMENNIESIEGRL